MQTRMLIDLNETVKKGHPAPEGMEKRYIRAGIAEEVKPKAAAPAAAPKKKSAPKRKAKAKPQTTQPAPAPEPVGAVTTED